MRIIQNHSKIVRAITLVVFLFTLAFNVQFTMKNNATGNSGFSFKNMEVSLFEKAQAYIYNGHDTNDKIWKVTVCYDSEGNRKGYCELGGETICYVCTQDGCNGYYH